MQADPRTHSRHVMQADPGTHSRRRSHPPVRCGDLGSLSEADQATLAVSPTLLALRLWHHGKTSCQTSKSSRQPACPAYSPTCSRCSCAGLATSQGWKTYACPKAVFFSELQEGKRDRGAPRKRYKDQLKRQLAQAGISHQSWQQEASDRDS